MNDQERFFTRIVPVSIAAGALVLAASVPVAAQDAEGGEVISGNFGTAMHLDSAEIQSFNLDDDEEEFVLYCFRDDVQEIEDDGFFVAGFDGQVSESAVTLQILESNDECVLAGFPAGTDLEQFSVAGVTAATVRNIEDEVNLPTTTALDGAEPSLSTRPALVEVGELDPTLNRATFVFNERLDEVSIDEGSFGYYTDSGLVHTADEAVSVEDEFVIVEWDEADGDEVEDAELFFVDDGAVQDRQGFPNLIGAIGGRTAGPDLESAGEVSDGLWSFQFDEAVVPVDASDFFLYTQNGERFGAEDFASVDAETVVTVFRNVEDFADQVTFAAVGPNAARSITADGAANTIGSESVEATIDLEVGVTAGPDLVSVESRADEGIIMFSFDQMLEDDATLDQDGFYLMTDAGEIVLSRAIVEVEDDHTLVLFDETLAEAAIAAGVLEGAVIDENGNTNLDRALIRFEASEVNGGETDVATEIDEGTDTAAEADDGADVADEGADVEEDAEEMADEEMADEETADEG